MTFRYDFAPTPFGDALAVFSAEGIVRFDLSEAIDPTVPWLLEGVSRQLGATPEPAPGAADELAQLLDDYFEGAPIRFTDHLRLDWRLAEGFTRTALQTICTIEWGQTMSYGEVAIAAGHPGAARAVGTACRVTPFSIIVPVHRVVRSDGSAGQYGAHPERKTFLLDLEAESMNTQSLNTQSLNPGSPATASVKTASANTASRNTASRKVQSPGASNP